MTKKVVEEFKPDLVGLTVMFGAHFNAAKLVGESIKKDYEALKESKVIVFDDYYTKGEHNGFKIDKCHNT